VQEGLENQSAATDVPPYAAVTVAVEPEVVDTGGSSSGVAPVFGLLVVVVLAYVAIMRRPGQLD